MRLFSPSVRPVDEPSVQLLGALPSLGQQTCWGLEELSRVSLSQHANTGDNQMTHKN
jgi:hypothetical protein